MSRVLAGTQWRAAGMLSATVLLALVTGLIIAGGSLALLGIWVALVASLALVSRPRELLILTFVLYPSQLIVPTSESGFVELFYPVALLTVASCYLRRDSSPFRLKWSVDKRCLAAFCAVVVFTMFFRGIGLMALGGQTAGAKTYLKVLTAAALAFHTHRVVLSVRQWRRAVTGMCIASVLPFAVDLLTMHGFIDGQALRGLIYTRVVHEPESVFGPNAISRYFSAAGLSAFTAMALLATSALRTRAGHYRPGILAALLAILLLGGISGHRLVIFSIPALFFVYALLDDRSAERKLFAVGSSLGVALLLLVLLSGYLPASTQRALSWLPGVSVGEEALLSAVDTTKWRLDLWDRVVEMVPSYWWIGKGYVFDMSDYDAALLDDDAELALVTNVYHSGVLSLLVGLGAGGLLTGIGFLSGFLWRHWRIDLQLAAGDALTRLHRAVLSWCAVQTVIYVMLYGDVQTSFVLLLVFYAMLEGLLGTWRARLQAVPGGRGCVDEPAWTTRS